MNIRMKNELASFFFIIFFLKNETLKNFQQKEKKTLTKEIPTSNVLLPQNKGKQSILDTYYC